MKYFIGFLVGAIATASLFVWAIRTENNQQFERVVSKGQRDLDSINRKYDLINSLTDISGGPAYINAKTEDGRRVILCIDRTWEMEDAAKLRSSIEKLAKLKELLDSKAITETEYEKEKGKILSAN